MRLLGKPIVQLVADTLHTSHKSDTEVREVAQELADMLRKSVGATKYLEAYSSVQQMVANLRAERRKRRAFEAVIDPQKRQEKRVKLNQKRKIAKQRKIASYRPGSGKGLKTHRA